MHWIVNKIFLLMRIRLEIEQLFAMPIGIKRVSVSGCAYGARPGAKGPWTKAWKGFNIRLFSPIVRNLSTAKLNQ